MKYTTESINKDILDFACTACHQLEQQFPTESSMKGKVVGVDAESLYHVYTLLIAYAYTYEQHHCECRCTEEAISC